MKRHYWGEFQDDTVKKKELRENEIILPISKLAQFRELPNYPNRSEKDKKILIKNALVTQTVEVVNQTQCLQTLLDTYSNKSGFISYALDPSCQPPNIDFPASNSAKMKQETVFSKPVWFCKPSAEPPPPKNYTILSKPTVLEALKKSLCGLLKVSGFTEIDESALTMYVDAIDEYYKSLLESVREVLIAESREQENSLDVMTLEKAYVNHSSGKSLTNLHNYFKDQIMKSNRDEISEFREVFSEYDKLLHENNLAQNLTNLTNDPKENGEFISFLDTSLVTGNVGFLDGENFRNLMDDNPGQDSILNE